MEYPDLDCPVTIQTHDGLCDPDDIEMYEGEILSENGPSEKQWVIVIDTSYPLSIIHY